MDSYSFLLEINSLRRGLNEIVLFTATLSTNLVSKVALALEPRDRSLLISTNGLIPITKYKKLLPEVHRPEACPRPYYEYPPLFLSFLPFFLTSAFLSGSPNVDLEDLARSYARKLQIGIRYRWALGNLGDLLARGLRGAGRVQ